MSDIDAVGAAGSEYADQLAAFVRDNRLPGGVAGVVHRDRLVWTGTVGHADLASGTPTTAAGRYDVASITKTFTGTAVMRLRDAGLLDLDDPAVTWLPELRAMTSPHARVEAVTIGRMLAHESGLMAEPPGTDWASGRYQGVVAETLSRPELLTVAARPHAAHRYSDLAYQLLGEIVARVTGQPFPDYLREQILVPLGLAATGYRPLPEDARAATGYQWRGLTDELDPAAGIGPVWSEGGLWSCLDDLARWVGFQLGAYRGEESPVLSAESRREMHRARYLAGGWSEAWGLSWCTTRRDDVSWIGHSGGITGFTSTLWFDPDSQVGAIVLVNGMTGDVGLGHALGATARRAATSGKPEIAIATPTITPLGYRPLLGIYARPGLGGWLMRVEWRDGALVVTTAEAPAWQLTLTPTDEPDVYACAPDGGTVTFARNDGGAIVSMRLFDTAWQRLEPAA